MEQRNLIFSTLLKSFLFLGTVFLFASCTVTSDDDDDTTPQIEEVMFRVDLVKITALEIKEGEGDALEIYGLINTKLIRDNISEENALWSVVKTEAIPVGLSDTPLSSSVTYTVATKDLASSNLEVRADLFDYDGSGNNAPEDLGDEAITTPLNAISSSAEYQITLNDSGGQVVQLTYAITRLP